MSPQFTIITRDNGIDREYFARTEYDALVLFNALTPAFLRVELWHGAEQKALYDNAVREILA